MNCCLRCGGDLLQHDQTKHTCTSCRFEQFNNPRAAVALLLFTKDNQLILTRRAHEPAKGKLDPIGGFLDFGDDFETALWRELQEETNLTAADITKLVYAGSAFNVYHWHGEDEPIAAAYFTATLTTEKSLEPADDVAAFVTYEFDAIPYQEIAWSEPAELIKSIVASRSA